MKRVNGLTGDFLGATQQITNWNPLRGADMRHLWIGRHPHNLRVLVGQAPVPISISGEK